MRPNSGRALPSPSQRLAYALAIASDHPDADLDVHVRIAVVRAESFDAIDAVRRLLADSLTQGVMRAALGVAFLPDDGDDRPPQPRVQPCNLA